MQTSIPTYYNNIFKQIFNFIGHDTQLNFLVIMHVSAPYTHEENFDNFVIPYQIWSDIFINLLIIVDLTDGS